MPVLNLFYFGSLTSLVPSIKLQEILIMMVCLHSTQVSPLWPNRPSVYCIVFYVLYYVLCTV